MSKKLARFNVLKRFKDSISRRANLDKTVAALKVEKDLLRDSCGELMASLEMMRCDVATAGPRAVYENLSQEDADSQLVHYLSSYGEDERAVDIYFSFAHLRDPQQNMEVASRLLKCPIEGDPRLPIIIVRLCNLLEHAQARQLGFDSWAEIFDFLLRDHMRAALPAGLAIVTLNQAANQGSDAKKFLAKLSEQFPVMEEHQADYDAAIDVLIENHLGRDRQTALFCALVPHWLDQGGGKVFARQCASKLLGAGDEIQARQEMRKILSKTLSQSDIFNLKKQLWPDVGHEERIEDIRAVASAGLWGFSEKELGALTERPESLMSQANALLGTAQKKPITDKIDTWHVLCSNMTTDAEATESNEPTILAIAGNMRSGTTLFADLLYQRYLQVPRHPQLALASDRLVHLLRSLPGEQLGHLHASFKENYTRDDVARMLNIDDAENAASILRNHIANRILAWAPCPGLPQAIGFKLTGMTSVFSLLKAVFSNPKMAIILRDPRDILASHITRMGGYLDRDQAYTVLLISLANHYFLQKENDEEAIFPVYFHHLTADPEKVVANTLNRIGLDEAGYDWASLQKGSVQINSSFGSADPNAVELNAGVRKDTSGRYLKVLTPKEIGLVEWLFEPEFTAGLYPSASGNAADLSIADKFEFVKTLQTNAKPQNYSTDALSARLQGFKGG